MARQFKPGQLQTGSLYNISASYAVTASYAMNSSGTTINTGSFATTGSNTFTGNQTINGNLTLNGTASISYLNVSYESASIIFSSGSNQLGDATNDTQTLIGTVIVSGSQRITGSLNVNGSINATSFSGSLFGTSSWSQNAVTASYVLNAVSSSFASTASYVVTAQTASYVLNAISSSFATTASRATTASFSTTASYVLNAVSASFVSTASYIVTAQTASFVTASNVVGPYGSNSVISSSFAVSASRSVSASFATTASYFSGSISNAVNATSASYAVTASYAMNGGGGGATPAGTYGDIQYNSGSALGANSSFKFIPASQSLQQGYQTTANGLYSHTEGSGTSTSTAGYYAHAEGINSQANANYAHAEGANTTAQGQASHAEGNTTTANNDFAHAEGASTTAAGQASHAEGNSSSANGQYSHAEGTATQANGYSSHAEGWYSQANGSYSHAEGYNTTAQGQASHAEGYNTTASGDLAHAEGNATHAQGLYSHAEGTSVYVYPTPAVSLNDPLTNVTLDSYTYVVASSNTGEIRVSGSVTANWPSPPYTLTTLIVTSSNGAVAVNFNYYTTPHVINSVTFDGLETLFELSGFGDTYHPVDIVSVTAYGNYSHAEGFGTYAQGEASHAEGLRTITADHFQHAQGQYNLSTMGQGAFILGNGTSDTNRSNLIFASGSKVQITGSLITNGSVLFGGLTQQSQNNVVIIDTATGQLYYTASSAFGGGGGSGAGFPFAGDAVITGSLLVSGSGIIVTGSLKAANITGSLFGTSSWASNAVTASYVLNAISSSFSSTASYVATAQTASYIQTAQTASYVLNAISSSFASTASRAITASYYQETDPIFTARSGSFATTGSNTFVGNQTISGSLTITGSTTQIGTNTLLGNTTLSGSIIISGSTTNPPSPTIRIYGDMETNGVIKFMPVVKSIDTSISASYVYVSGSTNDLYFSQNGAGYSNTTRLRWLESNLYTGLLSGGVIRSTIGSTTFTIESGSGIIVTLNASTASVDPYPTVQYVSWPTLTQSITNSGSAKITYVGISSAGTVVQQTIPWGTNNVSQWDQQIELGIVLHLSGSVSTGVYNSPQVSYGFSQRTDDFVRSFGPLKISGHTLQASGSTLSLIKTAGTSYNNGSNYTINPNHPSTVSDPAITTSKIYRYYISGSTPVIDTGVANAGYSVIDPTLYNNNGVLTSVPTNGANLRYTIQRVFWIPNSPTNAFIVYYGNTLYASLVDASNGIGTEVFTEAPNTAQNAILIGYILVAGDATDLTVASKATIVQGGLFRSVNGIGSSNTSPISTTLASLSDVAVSSLSAGDLLVYGGGQWANGKTITGNYTINGNLTVTGSITGTASRATTSSYAIRSTTASFADTVTRYTRWHVYDSVTSASIGKTYDYNGYAVSGSALTDSAWTITRLVITASGAVVARSIANNTNWNATGSVFTYPQ